MERPLTIACHMKIFISDPSFPGKLGYHSSPESYAKITS